MGPELNLLYWPSEFHPLRAYPLMTQPESALCRARPPVLKHRDNRNHFPKNLFNLLKKKSKSHLTFNGHKIVFQPINFTKMLPICVSSIQIQNHSKSNFLHHQNFIETFFLCREFDVTQQVFPPNTRAYYTLFECPGKLIFHGWQNYFNAY